MDKKVTKELNEMKYLFGYERGRVISEQKEVPMEEDVDFDVLDDVDVESNREIQIPVRPDVDTPTKPKKPGTPYSPKPGPKKNPKAEDERRIPDWLSFDELGINMGEE